MLLGPLTRRYFVSCFGGAVAAWPLAASAQQGERMRRIGVLMGITEDAEARDRLAVFREGLRERGWTEGGNIEFNYRWGAGPGTESAIGGRAAAMATGRDPQQLDAHHHRGPYGHQNDPHRDY